MIGEDDLRSGARADALVALGGDGLMMRMAHSFPGVPLLGINFGKVGFLAMVERAQWQDVLSQVIDGDYIVQDGPTLRRVVTRNGQQIGGGWAINDVVVRSGMQMIDVELYIDGRYVNTYPGDGMIVASPQGSTAYCMAAGGPILTAGVHGFAITPISAHSPIRATLVVPEESRIELAVSSDRDAYLILDGHLSTELQQGDVVTVSLGVRTVQADPDRAHELLHGVPEQVQLPDPPRRRAVARSRSPGFLTLTAVASATGARRSIPVSESAESRGSDVPSAGGAIVAQLSGATFARISSACRLARHQWPGAALRRRAFDPGRRGLAE